jgi:hypothetical protein
MLLSAVSILLITYGNAAIALNSVFYLNRSESTYKYLCVILVCLDQGEGAHHFGGGFAVNIPAGYLNRGISDINEQLHSVSLVKNGWRGCQDPVHVHCVGLSLSTRVDRISEVFGVNDISG